MREVPIDDMFCVALPEGVDPDSPTLLPELLALAMKTTWAQYQGRMPHELMFGVVDWLITGDPDEADAFQPAHDCPTCLAGADQARAFLKEHPRRMLALANLRYTEVWPE